MTAKPIAITGATGHLGGMIARELDAQGVATRLIVRSPEKAPKLDHAEIAVASYTDHDALVAACRDVSAVFFVSGFEAADRLAQHKAAVDAFAAASVPRVVYTSFINCAPDSTFTFAHDHFHTEAYMQKKGVPFAALRDNFYADMIPLLPIDGVIRGPAGTGLFAPVARTDVAATAAALLTDPDQTTGVFDVAGPELMTMARAAEILAEVTGQPVEYQEETLTEAYAARAHYDATKFELDGWVTSYAGIAAGEFATLGNAVERFTGRKPIALKPYLERIL
ncbi:MAG: NmrA family NAD(P)-binding protein [Thalassovita sp.]